MQLRGFWLQDRTKTRFSTDGQIKSAVRHNPAIQNLAITNGRDNFTSTNLRFAFMASALVRVSASSEPFFGSWIIRPFGTHRVGLISWSKTVSLAGSFPSVNTSKP